MPAPRFSATPSTPATDSGNSGEHTEDALRALGYDDNKIADLISRGVIGVG